MAKVKVNNIVSATHTPTAQPGILSAEFNVDEGDHLPDFDEGDIYPVGYDNVGTPGRFPVTGSIVLEDMSTAASLLAAAAANFVVIGKAAGGGANQTYTGVNAKFRSSRGRMERQRDGTVTLDFFCYSADGTTIPFTVT